MRACSGAGGNIGMNKKNGAGNSRDKAAKWVYGSHILWSKAFLLFILLNFCIFMGFDILLPTMSLYLEQQKLTGGEIGVIYGTFTISAILTRS
jgi:hypothetical protein